MPTQEQLDQFLGNPSAYADKGYFFNTMKKIDPRFAAADPAKQEQIYGALKAKFGQAEPVAPPAAATPAPAPSGGGVSEFMGDLLTGVRGGLRSTADFAGNVAGLVGLSPVQRAAKAIGETVVTEDAMREARERSPWAYGIGYGGEQLGEALLGGGAVKQGGKLALEGVGKYIAKEAGEKAAEAGAKTLAGKVVQKVTQTVPGQFGIYSAVKGDETGQPSIKAGLEGAVEGALFHRAGGIKSALGAGAAGAAIGGGRAAVDLSSAQATLDAANAKLSQLTPEAPGYAQAAGEKNQAEQQLEAAKHNLYAGSIMGAGMVVAPRAIPAVRSLTSMRVPEGARAPVQTPGEPTATPTGALAAESGIKPVSDARGRTGGEGAPPAPAAPKPPGGDTPPPGGAVAAVANPVPAEFTNAIATVRKAFGIAESAPDEHVIRVASVIAQHPDAITNPEALSAIKVLAETPAAAPAAAVAPVAAEPVAAEPAAATAQKAGLSRADLKDPTYLRMLEQKPNPVEEITKAIEQISARKKGNKEITPGTVANQLIGAWDLFPKKGNSAGLDTAELGKARQAAHRGLRDAVEVFMREKGMDFKPTSSTATAEPVTPVPAPPGAAPAAAPAPAAEPAAATAPAAPAAAKPAPVEYKPGTAGRIIDQAGTDNVAKLVQDALASGKVKNTNQLANKVLRGLNVKYGEQAWREFIPEVEKFLQRRPDLIEGVPIEISTQKAAKKANAVAPPEAPPAAAPAAAPVNGAPSPVAAPEAPAAGPAPAAGADLASIGQAAAAVGEYFGVKGADIINAAAVNGQNPNIPLEIRKHIDVINRAFPVEVAAPAGPEPVAGAAPGATASTANGPSQGQIGELVTKLNELNAKRKLGESRGTPNAAAIDANTKFTRDNLSEVYPQLATYPDEMIEKLGLFKRNPDGTFSISDVVANAWTAPDATRTAVTGEPKPARAPRKRGGGRKAVPKTQLEPVTPVEEPGAAVGAAPAGAEPIAPAPAPAPGGITPTPLQAAAGMKPIPASEDPTYDIKPTPKPAAHTLQDQLAANVGPQPKGDLPPLSAKEAKAVNAAVENFRDATGYKGNDHQEMYLTALQMLEEDSAANMAILTGDAPSVQPLPKPYVKALKDLVAVYDKYIEPSPNVKKK